MMAGSTNALQSEAGYIDARPHIRQIDEILLRRTAGPYIGSWLLSRVSSASCFRRNSSYSGVPSLGGASLGSPPIHAGVESMTFSEMLSIVVEHDASAI